MSNHELYLHILARSCIFRRKTYKDGFLQPWQVAEGLCKFFNLDGEYGWWKTLPSQEKSLNTRTDVFISRIFECKPWAIFSGIADEDYTEMIIGFILMLKWIENLSSADVMKVCDLIIEHGNENNPITFHQLQQSEYTPRMSEKARIGENGRGIPGCI